MTWRGLNAWKKQLLGTAEWDLARRMLKQVYTVRDLLHAARTAMMTGGEMEEALAATKRGRPLVIDGTDVSGLIAGYDQRWERVRKGLSALDLEMVEAEVLWGRDAKSAVDPLRDCAQSFAVQLHSYLRIQSKSWSNPTPEQREAIERVVFPIPGEDGVDAYAAKLQEAVSTAETFARPHLRR